MSKCKHLKFNASLSNVNSTSKNNSISMEPSNYWGHSLSSFVFLYTVNKDFFKLYNQNYINLHSKLFENIDNSPRIFSYFYFSETI